MWKKASWRLWHLKTKSFICHNVRHIIAKYPKNFSNPKSSSFSKKMFYYTQKVTHHPISKTHISLVLAWCSVRTWLPKPPTLSLLTLEPQIIYLVTEICFWLIRDMSTSLRQEQGRKFLLMVTAMLTWDWVIIKVILIFESSSMSAEYRSLVTIYEALYF